MLKSTKYLYVDNLQKRHTDVPKQKRLEQRKEKQGGTLRKSAFRCSKKLCRSFIIWAKFWNAKININGSICESTNPLFPWLKLKIHSTLLNNWLSTAGIGKEGNSKQFDSTSSFKAISSSKNSQLRSLDNITPTDVISINQML